MKRLISAASLFTMLAAATYSYAQTPIAKAAIPFDFQIGETSMPAGEYRISESGGYLLRVQGAKGQPSAILLTAPGSYKGKSKDPVLQFHRYGDEYYLAQIWNPDSNKCQAVSQSKRAKELARRATFERTEQVALQTGNSHAHNNK